jgi:hypothetical protein
MSFAQDGFPKGRPATTIGPRPVGAGSTLIQGIANNTRIVEQAGGIVVVEGSLNEVRAEALIAYVRRTFRRKQIRYVTRSHHHADHSGGVRPSPRSARRSSCTRRRWAGSSKCSPAGTRSCCPIASTTRTPTRRSRGAGRRLGDARRPGAPGRRAAREDDARDDDDPRVGPVGGRAVRQRRHLHAGGASRPGARSLEATIEANGLRRRSAGGHGGIITYAAFRQALGLPPA